jgi:putative flippase GtrA
MKLSIITINRNNTLGAGEFIRFCITGLICTIVHYGVYLLLAYLLHSETVLWTNTFYTIGYVLGFLCNLWLSASFTFKERVTIKRGIGFAISNAVNYGLHMLFLNLFLWIGISKQFAPIPTYCIVVPINFLLVRFVFKKL